MTRRDLSLSGGLSVAVWLALQLAALGLAAARCPLWARSPAAVEYQALAIVLVTQVGAASLLFPYLVQNRKMLIIALATAWPVGELASFLADADMRPWVLGELYVSVWLVALYLWVHALHRPSSRLYAMVLFSMFSLGGPVLQYLRADFGEASRLAYWPRGEALGPIMGILSLIGPQPAPLIVWIVPSVLASAAVAWQIRNAAKNRAKMPVS